MLSWVKFINQTLSELGPESSFYHGACLAFVDGIGCGTGKTTTISQCNAELVLNRLLNKCGKILGHPNVVKGNELYGISPFFIEKGNHNVIVDQNYIFDPVIVLFVRSKCELKSCWCTCFMGRFQVVPDCSVFFCSQVQKRVQHWCHIPWKLLDRILMLLDFCEPCSWENHYCLKGFLELGKLALSLP